jgi:hypothetical protein
MFGTNPGWADSGKPGPKSNPRKTAAALPDDPPAGLTQAERTHWLELREQLRSLGTACTADAGLVRMLAKQMARLDVLQAALLVHGPVRSDGTPAPLLKTIESLERTCAVNLNSLDLSPVRRRGAEMVIAGADHQGHIKREEWVWDAGLREVLSEEDVADLEAYRFPRAILNPSASLSEQDDDLMGGKYRLSYLCRQAETLEQANGPMARLLGGMWEEPNPFQGNPLPIIVGWIAGEQAAIKRGEFAGVLEAYQED